MTDEPAGADVAREHAHDQDEEEQNGDREGARQVELVLGMVHTFQNRLNAWISHVLEKGT